MLRKTRLLVGSAVMLLAANSQAAMITQYGDDVCFTYDDSTLFGTGTVINNNIFFTPADFIAESLNGAGLVQTAENLNLRVEITTADFWVSDFALFESGDYQLVGNDATAAVSGTFSVSSNTSAYSDSNNFDAGPLTVQNELTGWDAGTIINLSDTAGWGSDTDIDIDLYNLAEASTSSLGEEAFVQKKIGGVAVMITAVPVPAAVWMFGSGLLALVGWARRRQA